MHFNVRIPHFHAYRSGSLGEIACVFRYGISHSDFSKGNLMRLGVYRVRVFRRGNRMRLGVYRVRIFRRGNRMRLRVHSTVILGRIAWFLGYIAQRV